MKITKIEIQKRRPNRKSVWVDGKFYCGVSDEVLARSDLREEQVVSEDDLSGLVGEEERSKAKEYALTLLGYRMRSERELEERLERKGYSQRIVKSVLKDLRRVDLINDLEFARAWVRNRTETNPKGPLALRNELYKKGVARELIAVALEEFSSKYDEALIASEMARKKLRKHLDLKDPKARQKLMSFLTRRGFSYQTCKKVVEELKG